MVLVLLVLVLMLLVLVLPLLPLLLPLLLWCRAEPRKRSVARVFVSVVGVVIYVVYPRDLYRM